MFILVPAHPGFPGQISQSRKTVVVVVVVMDIIASCSKNGRFKFVNRSRLNSNDQQTMVDIMRRN